MDKKLIEKLNEIYAELDTIMDDETMSSFPKKFKKLRDNFGEIVQDCEDGKYDEDDDEDEDEDDEEEKKED